MGYITDYTLEIQGTFDTQLLNKELDAITDYNWEFYKDNTYYLCDAKWYNFDDHILKLSVNHPELVFHLYGVGEDSEDRWVEYYWNGHHSGGQAELIYPSFDPSLLGDLATTRPELLI